MTAPFLQDAVRLSWSSSGPARQSYEVVRTCGPHLLKVEVQVGCVLFIVGLGAAWVAMQALLAAFLSPLGVGWRLRLCLEWRPHCELAGQCALMSATALTLLQAANQLWTTAGLEHHCGTALIQLLLWSVVIPLGIISVVAGCMNFGPVASYISYSLHPVVLALQAARDGRIVDLSWQVALDGLLQCVQCCRPSMGSASALKAETEDVRTVQAFWIVVIPCAANLCYFLLV
eukprot:5613467-Amphidinium_carterae.1